MSLQSIVRTRRASWPPEVSNSGMTCHADQEARGGFMATCDSIRQAQKQRGRAGDWDTGQRVRRLGSLVVITIGHDRKPRRNNRVGEPNRMLRQARKRHARGRVPPPFDSFARCRCDLASSGQSTGEAAFLLALVLLSASLHSSRVSHSSVARPVAKCRPLTNDRGVPRFPHARNARTSKGIRSP
jgi:hypothetical protein